MSTNIGRHMHCVLDISVDVFLPITIRVLINCTVMESSDSHSCKIHTCCAKGCDERLHMLALNGDHRRYAASVILVLILPLFCLVADAVVDSVVDVRNVVYFHLH